MRTFNPDTNIAFGKFRDKYEDCLVQSMAFGRPSKEAANQLVDLLIDFGHDMNVDGGALEKARAAMNAGLVREYG